MPFDAVCSCQALSTPFIAYGAIATTSRSLRFLRSDQHPITIRPGHGAEHLGQHSSSLCILSELSSVVIFGIDIYINLTPRVQKLPYCADDGEAYEKATLLLANIHAAAGRLDAAADCARACLARNGASSQAWEVAGFVAELRDDAVAAGDAYAAAWRLSRMSSPAVGYRLAWNHLRAGAYVPAVTAALEVLDKFPGYPKISADVMMPALARIRAASERDSRARHAPAPLAAAVPASAVVAAA